MNDDNGRSRGPIIFAPSHAALKSLEDRAIATIVNGDIILSLPSKNPLTEENMVNLASVVEDLAEKMIRAVRGY